MKLRHSKWMPALATAAVVLLGACSAGSNGGSESVPTGGTASPTSDLTGVSLTMWVAQASASIAKQPIAAFEAATHAKVNTVVIPDPYESNVPTKLASGAKPDLMFWAPLTNTQSSIQPTKNLLTLDNEPWVQSLNPAVKSYGVVDGKRYSALISAPAVLGVYYNKSVFERAGITEVPTSYDQLLSTARTIKQKVSGVAPFFEVGADKWPLQWQVQIQMTNLPQSFWDDLNKNKASFADPRIVADITKYKTEVIDGGLTQPGYKTGTFVDQGINLYAGKTAMAVNVTALLSEIQASHSTADIDSTLGWFPLSADSSEPSGGPDQTNGLSVFNTGNTRRENAARQLIDFWLGPDYASFIAANKLPSIQPSVPSPTGVPKILDEQVTALSKGLEPLFQGKASNSPDMHLYLADMLYGTKTPQQVAQACEDQFVQVAKAQGLAGF